jgi:DNA-binding PadR family transcriptional regulator
MTELDFTILAIIARDGPLSAYDVRKDFAQSMTPTWSSSTGSVYPSIARLEAADLIAASNPEGPRSRKALSITAAGRVVLDPWLTGMTAETAAATPDPIRTRMFFLMLLEPSRRTEVVLTAIESTKAALDDAQRRRSARALNEADDLRRLASEGVVFELRARLAWLYWFHAELAAREAGAGRR